MEFSSLESFPEFQALTPQQQQAMRTVLGNNDFADPVVVLLIKDYLNSITKLYDSVTPADKGHWSSYSQGIGRALDVIAQHKRGL